jgi:hypothetical protein
MAKVKVIKKRKEICGVQCCHLFYLFIVYGAKVILFSQKQAFLRFFFSFD